MLGLVSALMYGLTFSIQRILELHDVSSLVVLNAFSCFVAALLCLRAAPRGLRIIFDGVKSLALPPSFRQALSDKLIQLEMEEDVLRLRLNKLSARSSPSSRVSWTKPQGAFADSPLTQRDRQRFERDAARVSDAERRKLMVELQRSERKKRKILGMLSMSVWRRNLLFLVAMAVSVTLWGLFVSQLGLNIVKNSFFYLRTWIDWRTAPLSDLNPSHLVYKENIERILGQTSSYLGFFGSMMELLLVLYFCIICLLGAFWPESKEQQQPSSKLAPAIKMQEKQQSSKIHLMGGSIMGGSPFVSKLRARLASSFHSRPPSGSLSHQPSFASSIRTTTQDMDVDGSSWDTTSPTQWLLLHLTLLLLLTSSMPSLVRFIGITRFDPIGYYAFFGAIRSWLLTSVLYKSILLFLLLRGSNMLLWSLVDLLRGSESALALSTIMGSSSTESITESTPGEDSNSMVVEEEPLEDPFLQEALTGSSIE